MKSLNGLHSFFFNLDHVLGTQSPMIRTGDQKLRVYEVICLKIKLTYDNNNEAG